MKFQAQIQITMCAHMLKSKEEAHIVGMRWVGMRSKDKNKEEMRQTVQGGMESRISTAILNAHFKYVQWNESNNFNTR